MSNLIIKREFNLANYYRDLTVFINSEGYKLKNNERINIDFKEGKNVLLIKSGSFKSKEFFFDATKEDIFIIQIRTKFSNLVVITANLILILSIIANYIRTDLLRMTWILLAIYSLLPIYFFLIKRNDFFNVRINKNKTQRLLIKNN